MVERTPQRRLSNDGDTSLNDDIEDRHKAVSEYSMSKLNTTGSSGNNSSGKKKKKKSVIKQIFARFAKGFEKNKNNKHEETKQESTGVIEQLEKVSHQQKHQRSEQEQKDIFKISDNIGHTEEDYDDGDVYTSSEEEDGARPVIKSGNTTENTCDQVDQDEEEYSDYYSEEEGEDEYEDEYDDEEDEEEFIDLDYTDYSNCSHRLPVIGDVVDLSQYSYICPYSKPNQIAEQKQSFLSKIWNKRAQQKPEPKVLRFITFSEHHLIFAKYAPKSNIQSQIFQIKYPAEITNLFPLKQLNKLHLVNYRDKSQRFENNALEQNEDTLVKIELILMDENLNPGSSKVKKTVSIDLNQFERFFLEMKRELVRIRHVDVECLLS